ncbi:MAG: lipoprotein insertase outer membrane protein LolB [Azonexus sp.]
MSCFRCAAWFAGSLLLAGCVSAPAPRPAGREQIRDFALEARFALRITPPEQAAQSSGGRLSWEHKNGADRLLIANPLGIGMAEIEITPALSRLRTADGRQHESSDPDALIAEVTGQALPVSRLPAWLLGRAEPNTSVEPDASGRPGRFREAGWQIEYAYADETANALPTRLTLSREPDIELRLRIEEWRDAP